MEIPSKYISEVYHFKGKCDLPSLCGITVVVQTVKTIVIATNLYESNPGTSISRWIAPLATTICEEFNIPSEKLIFIEHNPDRNSKLDFYKQTFDAVEFTWDGEKLTDPKWRRISKEEMDGLLG